MYSHEGKRFVNQVLAGKEQALGSHISLGINLVYDASLDGSTAPTTHNRYHSPYIVDDIEIVNSSVISASVNDEIIFSGQANAAKRYIANNIALVVERPSGSARTARTLANVVSTAWNCAADASKLTRPEGAAQFTSDGILELDHTYTATFSEPVSLYGGTVNDIIAIPMYFLSGVETIETNPTGLTITVKFRYLIDGVEKYCEYEDVIDGVGGFGFSNDPANNRVGFTGSYQSPSPFIWQKRISDTSDDGPGTTAQDLINNGKNIVGIDITLTGGGASDSVRFGSIKLTPDFESDTTRTTIAFRELASLLYKTDDQVYTNAEYRVKGV